LVSTRTMRYNPFDSYCYFLVRSMQATAAISVERRLSA
jgi:hypothetical protein